ncbi:BTAD domain-containing putative transcriptional regulator [Streptomyces sp. NPDC006551]|uniref:BTAD domain-containing putative transcriptional regulator n=1 Tax=Streptomyces sp. NPDC006551 TaxID=3157178 RepID=UPI00339FA560
MPSYRVLGPSQALRADGGEAVLGGARLRSLLAALAAAGGRGVGTGELIAQIWPDTPPRDGTAALQALVGRLRRTLGREAVVSTPGGYRLAADPDDVDLYLFERLAADGADALGAGEAEKAARLLDEALALWRGPALADLPGRDDDPLVVRTEQRHTQARRDRLAADVALGRARAALAPLAALAAEHPLDETVQALRIRALRAAGRAAEALQAYDEVRTVLAERLGADPGPELRELHARLLADDGAPGSDLTARLPLLPARLTSFIGRETELATLGDELSHRRLVTLLGPGGVGKTRLALEAVAAQGRPEEVRVAELASVREGADVPEAVLTALGARETQMWNGAAAVETTARDPLGRLVEHCAARRILLLLDNCEHVVDAVAGLVERLLARCPGVTVLATSREPLGVPGESMRPVEPLTPDSALRLLAARGADARPGFDPEDDPEACAEICRRLDGLPLAIELAAARLRLLTPRQIVDRLDDRFRLLTSGARTVLPRQQTLRAVVDWSWDLLDERERAVLRRLSVFTGGCDLEAAEAVCASPGTRDGRDGRDDLGDLGDLGDRDDRDGRDGLAGRDDLGDLDGVDHLDVLPVLGSLVDKSLVVAAPVDGGAMRYHLLETVAEYAAERLDEAGDREATERRHLVHYRELARRGDALLRGPGQRHWLRCFEREHDNLTTALRTAVALGEEQEALCVVLSMSWFWQLRVRQSDALTWSVAAAALGPDPFATPVRRAVPLTERPTGTPPPWNEEQLWEARRDCRLVVLACEGTTDLERPRTRERLRAIVSAYRPGMPQNCRQPGSMWFFARLMTGEFTSLGETLEAAVDACRVHGGEWELAFTFLMRAKCLGERPDDADQALTLFEAVQDSWGVAESLAARGEAYERAGRLADAAADYERAMAGAARLGARTQVPVFKARLADVRLRLATDEAARSDAESLLVSAAEEAGECGTEAVSTARLLLAQYYGSSGRTALAREQLRLAEQEFSEVTPDLFTGTVGGVRGWLDCLDGAYEEAAGQLARAVEALEKLAYLVAPYLVVSQFATAAWARAGLGTPGSAEDGARLLGAYDALSATAGGVGFLPLTARTEASVRDRAERALRAVLDPPTYARRYEEGGRLSVKEAAVLVRRHAPPGPDAREGSGQDNGHCRKN